MEYKRKIYELILKRLQENKVLVLYGARRTGKTFLLKMLMKEIKEDYLFINGEDVQKTEFLHKRSINHYKNVLGSKKLLVIDEAQKIDHIGEILKLMVDGIDGIKIIVSGSSALDIMNKAGEPLVGRKITLKLHPLAEAEFAWHEDHFTQKENYQIRMVYGSYPEVSVSNDLGQKAEILNEITNSYLLKDILSFEGIKNSSKIFDLLKLISFQVGQLVSYEELGRQLKMSKNTVEKYLDILSKNFIIFKIGGYSRNLRKEITKNNKWYFFDNGIRNALIANLNPLNLRNDIGELWENYIISERIKYQENERMIVNNYFWRTYTKQEIDLIEERGGNLYAYELKFKKTNVSAPKTWNKAYPNSEFMVINNENFLDWLK